MRARCHTRPDLIREPLSARLDWAGGTYLLTVTRDDRGRADGMSYSAVGIPVEDWMQSRLLLSRLEAGTHTLAAIEDRLGETLKPHTLPMQLIRALRVLAGEIKEAS